MTLGRLLDLVGALFYALVIFGALAMLTACVLTVWILVWRLAGVIV